MTSVTIEIGMEMRVFSIQDIDEQWIAEQLRNRRHDGQEPCIKIAIHADGVAQIRLQTENCPKGRGSWNPNPTESGIFDIWKEKIVGDSEVSPGSLISFLAAVRNLLK